MTDESDKTTEFVLDGYEPDESVILHDGSCWVFNPAFLDPASEAEGVIAIQYSAESGLWYLDGATRKWISATEAKRHGPTLTRIQ